MNRTSPFIPTKEEYEIFNIPVEYPESDGEPLAESDFQLVWIVYLLDALRYFFRQREDVYVAGNLILYYEEGYPPSFVAPDIFVAFGVGNHKRKTYKIWEEGETPSFILEVLSSSTVLKDRADKKGLYEFLGVQEYYLFDPIGNLMPAPQLQGYHLVNGRYQSIPSQTLTNGGIALTSDVLGLELHAQENQLRLFNQQAGHYLLTYEEAESARATAEERAEAAEEQVKTAREQAKTAESRIAELEARLRALGQDV